MKHVKLFENWEEENLSEAEDIIDSGEDTEETAEETPEEAKDGDKEGYVGDLMLSWETVKGDVLDKYRDGAITKEEAMSLLG